MTVQPSDCRPPAFSTSAAVPTRVVSIGYQPPDFHGLPRRMGIDGRPDLGGRASQQAVARTATAAATTKAAFRVMSASSLRLVC